MKGTERNELVLLICFNSKDTAHTNSKSSLNMPTSLHLSTFQLLPATLSSFVPLDCLSSLSPSFPHFVYLSSGLSVSRSLLASIVLKGEISAFTAMPEIRAQSFLAFQQLLRYLRWYSQITKDYTHTHTTRTHTSKDRLPPPSQRSIHPDSNWQLLLAHPSTEPPCYPAVFHQCNYNVDSGMSH